MYLQDCHCTFEGQKSFYAIDDQPVCGPCAGIGEEEEDWIHSNTFQYYDQYDHQKLIIIAKKCWTIVLRQKGKAQFWWFCFSWCQTFHGGWVTCWCIADTICELLLGLWCSIGSETVGGSILIEFGYNIKIRSKFIKKIGNLKYLILVMESEDNVNVLVIHSVLNRATIDNSVTDCGSNCKFSRHATKYSYFLSCSRLLAQGVVKNWFHLTLGTLTTWAMNWL